ncbi:MAG: N-acetylmuramoyl-L-alanine amidase [Granulosicoccus sp.]
MDNKLLGCSGFVALAVFTLIVQHGTGSQASSFESNNTKAKSIDLAKTIGHPIDTALGSYLERVKIESSKSSKEPTPATAIVVADEESSQTSTPVRALTRFTLPVITGVLSPDGFKRPAWQTFKDANFFDQQQAETDHFVIMLDPGHGGTDPGAQAHNGLLEKELTLDIARRVRLFLSEFDKLKVVLTREYDHGLSRQSRVDAIRKSKADMVVSLHFNHLPQTDVTLVESFYAGPENIEESQTSQRKLAANSAFQKTRNQRTQDLGFTKGSARLAHALQQRVYNEVSFENPNVDNAGVKQETLFVLTRSFTPGVLIELTCLSNIQEADKLNSEDYRNRLAAALADGIRTYQESLDRAPLENSSDIGA